MYNTSHKLHTPTTHKAHKLVSIRNRTGAMSKDIVTKPRELAQYVSFPMYLSIQETHTVHFV